jgi:hypothetical protein
MRKKTLLFGVVLVLSMMVFVGCGNMNNSATDNTQESPEATHADLRDDDTGDNNTVSPGVDNDNGDASDGIEQGVDDAVDGAEDAVDDVIDGTEDAVDDAADALDGDDNTTTKNKNNR